MPWHAAVPDELKTINVLLSLTGDTKITHNTPHTTVAAKIATLQQSPAVMTNVSSTLALALTAVLDASATRAQGGGGAGEIGAQGGGGATDQQEKAYKIFAGYSVSAFHSDGLDAAELATYKQKLTHIQAKHKNSLTAQDWDDILMWYWQYSAFTGGSRRTYKDDAHGT